MLNSAGEVTWSAPTLGAAIWRVRGAIRFDVGLVQFPANEFPSEAS